jgi:hypothetical protein
MVQLGTDKEAETAASNAAQVGRGTHLGHALHGDVHMRLAEKLHLDRRKSRQHCAAEPTQWVSWSATLQRSGWGVAGWVLLAQHLRPRTALP